MKNLIHTFHIKKVIWYLTFSDIFTWGLFMALNSLAGIYLATKLGENVVMYVGIGTGIYAVTKAGAQIPFGLLEDKIKTEKDELYILIIGNVLMGLPYLFYPIISTPYLFFFLQFIFGLGSGMNIVSWRKLFANNLDKNREGLEYGIYETTISLSIAVLSALISYIANLGQIYFDMVIVAIGILMILGGLWGVLIYRMKFVKQ